MRAVKVLMLCSLLVATAAHADIFMCKDASGRTITSDRPIPECADRAIREYSNKGRLKKEIAAPLTPQQKRALAEQEEKEKAAQVAADEQRREDRALIARYRSENDIASARQRDTSSLNEQMARQKAELAAAEKEWATADAAQKAAGKPTPNSQVRVAKSAQKVLDARATIRDIQDDLARINAKYDQILQRYREIMQTASAQ
jgi:uncharacterized protein involved in exopolysaccharide biosynthesis